MIARGNFDVKVTPIPFDATAGRFNRLLLDKQIHGDLEAASEGEMMGTETQVNGSAGYVAVERVSGTLHGKRGSFVLQHKSTMRKGADLTVKGTSGRGTQSTDQYSLKGLAQALDKIEQECK